jgi:Zn-dependent protease with chaperone function
MHFSYVSLSGRLIGALLALSLALAPVRVVSAASAPPIPLTAAPGTNPTPEPTTEANVHLPSVEEIKMGREGSVEVEKEYKLVTDETQIKRLRTIGEEILRAANDPDLIRAYREQYKVPKKGDKSKRVPFQFSFKIVKSREVNAFSLAGGPIYFTTGLLEYVQSDHELAAVMAHEMTHVLHHHLVHLVAKQAKTEQKMLWVMLASILAGAAGSPDFSNVLVGAQLYAIAKQYGYGREAESDADHTGLQFMIRSKYNPVGMLTFMRRLARDENRRPPVEMGIFQSHPYTKERADAIAGYLAEAGIKVDRGIERDISNAFQITSRTAEMGGREVGEVMLNGQLLFRPAVMQDGLTPAQRASYIADELRRLLDENLLLRQVRLSADRCTVMAAGVPLVRVLPGDAELAGTPVSELAAKVLTSLQKALWKEEIDRSP